MLIKSKFGSSSWKQLWTETLQQAFFANAAGVVFGTVKAVFKVADGGSLTVLLVNGGGALLVAGTFCSRPLMAVLFG